MFYVSLFLNYSSRRKLLKNYYHLNKNVTRSLSRKFNYMIGRTFFSKHLLTIDFTLLRFCS